MSQATLGDTPGTKHGSGLQLALTHCPLCGHDEGEPIAVGNDFACRITTDSFLLLACSACGLLYLNPRPVAGERPRLYPAEYFVPAGSPRLTPCVLHPKAVAALVRSCGTIDPNARILEVAYGAELHLEQLRQIGPATWQLNAVTPHRTLARAAEQAGFTAYEDTAQALEGSPGAYDLILLVFALEHCASPVEELASLRRLLRPGGRLAIVTPNAASAAWRLFRGRHWAGYDFPRHPCLYQAPTLRRLASACGFTVDRMGTRHQPGMWTVSADNFLSDWAAPAWLTRAARPAFAVLGAVAALQERVRRAESPGARLEAVLRKPLEARL